MKTAEQQSVAIVGGGILGMTLALRLAEGGHEVTLIERSDQLGGLADAWQLGDVTWDRHYHVTLLSDSHTRCILNELKLDDDMQWVETKTGFFTNGKLYSMSSSLEFLLFPPLDLISKFRLGWTIFYGSKIRDWKRLERIPVADWLTRWSGKKTFEKMWLPLLRSKLGENYRKTSAAFIWATIARLYAARRTGLKKELFGYLPGGYDRMLRAFEERLVRAGVTIRKETSVAEVASGDDGVNISIGNDSESFDRCVLTVPSSLVPRICPTLPEPEKEAHSNIEYQGIVCASLLLNRPLGGYYVTNITDDGLPFTGVIEMTTLVDPAEFGGKHLVYLPKYLPANDPAYDLSDDELRGEFVAGLKRMYPDFKDEHIEAFRISRVKSVMALSTLGYSEKLPPQETGIAGVDVVNSAQIVNGTLNVNESIRLAEDAATRILGSMQPSRADQRELQDV